MARASLASSIATPSTLAFPSWYDGDIRDGDLLDIDFANGVIRNHRDNTQGRFTPFPEFLQKIITAGGLFKAKEIMQ